MKREVILLAVLCATSLSGCSYNKESLMQYDYPYPMHYQNNYPYNYGPSINPYTTYQYPYMMGTVPYYPYPIP